MKDKPLELPANLTARSRIVATLTQEILNSPETKTFPLGSESQLCCRFSVSRVTVRHALSDFGTPRPYLPEAWQGHIRSRAFHASPSEHCVAFQVVSIHRTKNPS